MKNVSKGTNQSDLIEKKLICAGVLVPILCNQFIAEKFAKKPRVWHESNSLHIPIVATVFDWYLFPGSSLLYSYKS